ncbi:pyridoxamine 5'-phosphate oxidase family protein [Salinibacter sp.]|uniref:pyridoxamine 5'-phosphate oxidase family protein n=1 Tax=Salinibacter sp. TaxID=2065818 RepID=UPI0035D4A87A
MPDASMKRYTNLESVLNHVWSEIEAASQTRGHPYRQPTFGTIHDGAPSLRTVVLRRADAGDRTLQFHSDRRSQKVSDIRNNSEVAWHGWNQEAKEQIRLHGTATIHLDDDVATSLWESQSPSSLVVYARPPAPGSELEEPEDGLRPAVKTEPITDADVAAGRQYFAAIQTVIHEMEWLHLHPDGHYRAHFTYQPERQAFEGSWVVP